MRALTILFDWFVYCAHFIEHERFFFCHHRRCGCYSSINFQAISKRFLINVHNIVVNECGRCECFQMVFFFVTIVKTCNSYIETKVDFSSTTIANGIFSLGCVCDEWAIGWRYVFPKINGRINKTFSAYADKRERESNNWYLNRIKAA